MALLVDLDMVAAFTAAIRPMAISPEMTVFDGIAFTDEEVALLMELSEACHVEPRVLIASIVSDVLRDSAEAIPARATPEGVSLH